VLKLLTGQLLVSLLPYLADDVGIALHVGAQDELLGGHLGQADVLGVITVVACGALRCSTVVDLLIYPSG
jgi:hypothetical protein